MQSMTGVNESMVDPSVLHEVDYEVQADDKMVQHRSAPSPSATQRMIDNTGNEDVVVLFDSPSVKCDLKRHDRKRNDRSERKRKEEKKSKGTRTLLGSRDRGESKQERKSKPRLGNSGRSKRRSKSSSSREKFDLRAVAPTTDHAAAPPDAPASAYSAERHDPEVSKPPPAMTVEDSPNIRQNRILSAMLDEGKLGGDDTITFHYVPPASPDQGCRKSDSVTIKYKGGPPLGSLEDSTSEVAYVAPMPSSDKPSLLGCTIAPPNDSDRQNYHEPAGSNKPHPRPKNPFPPLDQAKPVVSPSTTFDGSTASTRPESAVDDSMSVLGSTTTFDDSMLKMGVAAKRAAAKRGLLKALNATEKADENGAASRSMPTNFSSEATAPIAVGPIHAKDASSAHPPPLSDGRTAAMKRNCEPAVEILIAPPSQELLPPPMVPPPMVGHIATNPRESATFSASFGLMDESMAAPSPAPGVLPTATAAGGLAPTPEELKKAPFVAEIAAAAAGYSCTDIVTESARSARSLQEFSASGPSVLSTKSGNDARNTSVPTAAAITDLQIETSPSDEYPDDSPYQRKVSLEGPDSKPPATSNSGSRSGRTDGVGLSELSKQLRILQAKNQSQSVEIDRLERQLAILADLKGINVAELRKALEAACEAEAHDELQRRVAALRAQLEAATGNNGKDNNENQSSVVPVSNKPSFDEEASSQRIANLQLRIGELEETEDALRSEINGLYARLRDQSGAASRLLALSKLQATNIELQRQEIDHYKQRINFLEHELMRREEEEKMKTAMVPYEPPIDRDPPAQQDDLAIVPFEEPQLNLVFEFQAQKAAAEEAKKEKHEVVSRLQEKEVELQVEQDRVKVLEGQVRARAKDYRLKNDQYKARFQMQDERLRDLEQQLSSLYKAFDMLKEEREAEDVTRLALSENLYDADNRVAKQMDELQEASDEQRPKVVQGTPVTRRRPPSIRSRASSGSSRPKPTPNPSWSAIASGLEPVIRGFLWKRGSDLFRQWKKRYFSLYDNAGGHQLHYTEGPRREMRGTLCYLTKGITTVTAAGHEFPKHPYAFVIRLNPMDAQAPVINAAAASKEAFDLWMTALTVATVGEVGPQSMQSESPTTSRDILDASRASTARGSMTAEEQEAADHELALQMQYGDD